MNTHRPQAGFSMVEVMVALVVLAVGMLGMASLYVTTLRSSGSAISRMQAVNLASDMADRIRANRFAGEGYMATATARPCSGTNNCTQTEMAENDLFTWQAQIDDLLGDNAEGRVAYVAGAANAPDNYTITVLWREPGSVAEDGNGQLSYTMTMQIEP